MGNPTKETTIINIWSKAKKAIRRGFVQYFNAEYTPNQFK
jgi:hypothetical protein